MKILHINSYYNGSFFYKNLYNKQIEDKMDIDVYVPVANNTDLSKLSLGEYTKISPNHGKYDRALFHFKHNKIYKDIIKQYDIGSFDIFHAHSLFSNGYIAYKLNKKYGIPYIVAVRNTDINIFFSKMIHLRKLGINILRNAQKIVFISDNYKDLLLDRYIPFEYKEAISEKSRVIPNGIDKFWLNNIFYDRDKPKEKVINILYVGVVDKNKNIKATIEACRLLLDEGFNIKYTIVGAIKDEKEGELLHATSFINYIDHTNKEGLLNYYRDSDIFVMPSIHETFGIVYIEAMSQGLPLIYTKGQGFDGQFYDGEVGYSVEADSPLDISQRIKDILVDYKKISSNCMNNVGRFSWDEISKIYEDLYNEVLN